jgi:hypothetical protein
MLGSPDEAWVLAARPVLRSNKAAVIILRGRAISRKGSNDDEFENPQRLHARPPEIRRMI